MMVYQQCNRQSNNKKSNLDKYKNDSICKYIKNIHKTGQEGSFSYITFNNKGSDKIFIFKVYTYNF